MNFMKRNEFNKVHEKIRSNRLLLLSRLFIQNCHDKGDGNEPPVQCRLYHQRTSFMLKLIPVLLWLMVDFQLKNNQL